MADAEHRARAAGLANRIRLVVLTDTTLALPRRLTEVVEAALDAGAPAIQLRNKGESARALLAVGHDLRALTRRAGALLFVNDRLDVAMAVEADGVHVGAADLPVAAIRAVVPVGFLIGRSADEPSAARRAVDEGADYIGCGTVYETSSKPDAGQVIGLEGLTAVVQAVNVPVVGIGGITPARAVTVASKGAAGVAVLGAVMSADEVGQAVADLLAPWRIPREGHRGTAELP